MGNVCDEVFDRKGDVMMHKKREHKDKVASCWDFSSGVCKFREEFCWFNHCEDEERQTNVECNWCEKTYKSLADFLKHKKKEHKEFVPKCRNSESGTCPYKDSCWFIHDGNENENIINEKQDIGKLFSMMDKITKRLVH